MTESTNLRRLSDAAPDLARLVKSGAAQSKPRFAVREIRCQTVMVPMRDGVRLATDLYLPPPSPAPTIVMRTPYGRAADDTVKIFFFFARRGYAVVSQDCRGTGDSEPDEWNYYLNEPEDGCDLIEWVRRQEWFDGFIGSCGGSYVGQTQWQMAMHPKMSTIVPEVSGLGVGVNTMRLHLFLHAFASTVGKGEGKVDVPFSELEEQLAPETLATGFYNEPLNRPPSGALLARFPGLSEMPPGQAQRYLWERYCSLPCAGRVTFVKDALETDRVTIVEVESLPSVFGHRISHDRHTLPTPDMEGLVRSMHAPVFMRTGWYDWGLNDALATWDLLRRASPAQMWSRCRLTVAPSAHNALGYHEGLADHPELQHAHRSTSGFEVLLRWYEAARRGETGRWPKVTYYLMGANEWRVADDWPVPDARPLSLYLQDGGRLASSPGRSSGSDRYTYDPNDPTPTMGGSIVSYTYPPGSVDVAPLHQRSDVLTYTTTALDHDLDLVGPMRLVLFASSSAVDTDFMARLSDVFPDGRAIQIQSGGLRARYRNAEGEPELMVPGRVYRLEIDMWATANRFRAGHRLRLDVSSADFPRFDRNTNLGGKPGSPVSAVQTVYHDAQHPSEFIAQSTDGPGSL